MIPTELAPWAARAAALCLDMLLGVAVLVTMILAALALPVRGSWWWGCVIIGVAAVLWTVFNRILLASHRGGQSLGRSTFDIGITRSDGSAVGPLALLLRDVAHVLDTAALFLGWLWPLRDSRRRTFADILLGTESRVCIVPGPGDPARRRASALVLTAALLSAAGAAISYAVVYQQNRSIGHASADIAAHGPTMVEQILSYHPETLQADFGRARSLVTENYRPTMATQQQAIQKAGPVRNEYWVTNSALLSVIDGRATMLLFLQGQRGTPPNQRYSTASVRATFVQSGSAPWRIDDLTVVTTPQPMPAKP